MVKTDSADLGGERDWLGVEPEVILVDINEVARRLGVSVSHVKRMRDKGELPPARKVGRLLRWYLPDILAYVRGDW